MDNGSRRCQIGGALHGAQSRSCRTSVGAVTSIHSIDVELISNIGAGLGHHAAYHQHQDDGQPAELPRHLHASYPTIDSSNHTITYGNGPNVTHPAGKGKAPLFTATLDVEISEAELDADVDINYNYLQYFVIRIGVKP
jgi:hypothetical protein